MIMKTKEKAITQIINGFQNHKGKASVYCFSKSIIPEIIYNIVTRFHAKNKDYGIFIAVDKYETRANIYKYLKEKELDLENDYNIKILSVDYIKLKYQYSFNLVITVGLNQEFDIIKHLYITAKFMLCILTKNIMDNGFINSVRNILPTIANVDLDTALRKDNIYSPVEEHRYGVELNNEDKELYDKYNEYIDSSIKILGSLDNIEKCKYGDVKLNISNTEFRYNLAIENGWRSDLDTSIPYMRQIDDNYNPNVLYERACNFYNIAKQRKDLVTDNIAKLEIIKNICENNKDKQILIISKRGEFAAEITKYINKHLDNICGDYHDCIDDAIAIDDFGCPILIKSGENKGKPKIIRSQAQSTLNEQRFNDGSINILSIKNSSNTKLKIACDLVILTTPLMDNIIDIKTRFANIKFNGEITNVYKIYCIGTIEYDTMAKENILPIIKVMDETENFVEYDENNNTVIW